jgi:hypothetical protein
MRLQNKSDYVVLKACLNGVFLWCNVIRLVSVVEVESVSTALQMISVSLSSANVVQEEGRLFSFTLCFLPETSDTS